MYKLEKGATLGISDLIKEGEYEVQLERMTEGETPNGKKKIDLMFRFRDIEGQGYINRVLFDTVWKERETEYYNRKRLNMLLGTQDFEDGKTFKDIKALIDEVTGCFLRIKVDIVFDNYRNKEVNKILCYMSSEQKPKKVEQVKEELTEEELPF